MRTTRQNRTKVLRWNDDKTQYLNRQRAGYTYGKLQNATRFTPEEAKKMMEHFWAIATVEDYETEILKEKKC